MFDRAGACYSEEYQIDSHPKVFLRVLAGLLFAETTTLGFDPTITISGGVKQVEVTNMYTIHGTIFRSQVIRGRATICWHATRNGMDYVIKDTWIDTARQTKHKILNKLQGVEGVPRVVEAKVLTIHGHTDLTDSRRAMFRDLSITCNASDRQRFKKLENCIHVRLVLEPFTTPIWNFTSKRELLSVLIDIVKGELLYVYIIPSLLYLPDQFTNV